MSNRKIDKWAPQVPAVVRRIAASDRQAPRRGAIDAIGDANRAAYWPSANSRASERRGGPAWPPQSERQTLFQDLLILNILQNFHLLNGDFIQFNQSLCLRQTIMNKNGIQILHI